MKIKDLEGKDSGESSVPKQFEEMVNPDLIERAVLAVQSLNRQRYGADPEAGKKASAELSRRRRKYRGSYGFGISRVPRKILSRRGTRMNWVGAFAPGTVGGRRAHPPKAGKNLIKKINNKENKKAIRSALAASVNREAVVGRGHKVPDDYPFFIESKFEDLAKTKDVIKSLHALGLGKEIERCGKRTIRAGKGKARGRKYRNVSGVLLIVAKDCKLLKAAGNITGVKTVKIDDINAELLAPGCAPGRLSLFTKSAVEKMEKEKLFM
ncbi:50S ribosomal protein L4 [Candidatus Woesearchaeota archaeon]|nr:50S ribosomal protein L4 [Candidatus Woesearchaeota archaeon]